MALLMRYAMNNEVFLKISKTKTYQAETRSYAWLNKNKLLTSFYDYCTGGKTGFTRKAGRTLVTSARKSNLDLIAVTLNAPDDWNDHIKMYECELENFNVQSIQEKRTKDEKHIFPLTEEKKEVPIFGANKNITTNFIPNITFIVKKIMGLN